MLGATDMPIPELIGYSCWGIHPFGHIRNKSRRRRLVRAKRKEMLRAERDMVRDWQMRKRAAKAAENARLRLPVIAGQESES